MSFTRAASKLLTNKYFSYFIVFLAITNILGYLVTKKLNAVIFFALISLITFQFSKNITIVLLVGLISTNFLMANKGLREGLENASDSTEVIDKLKSENPEMGDAADVLNKEGTVEKAKAKLAEKTDKSANDIQSPKDYMNPDLNTKGDDADDADDADAPVGVAKSGGTVSESFKGSKLSGAPVGNSNTRIDYASTMESAYDNLDKILGSESISKLTNDTQKLMSKQQQLFDTMQTMAPALNEAKDMLKGFDLKGLGDMANLAQTIPGVAANQK